MLLLPLLLPQLQHASFSGVVPLLLLMLQLLLLVLLLLLLLLQLLLSVLLILLLLLQLLLSAALILLSWGSYLRRGLEQHNSRCKPL